MTQSHNSVYAKRFHLTILVILVLCIGLTGAEGCYFSRLHVTVWNVLKCFFTTKYTLLLFPLQLLVIGGIGMYITHKTWKESLLDDKMGRAFRHSGKISPYGGAHVMEPYEYVDVAQIRRLEDCKGIIVGRLSEDDTSECVDFNPQRINSHMYVVAMSGSGKTYGFVKPYIFQSVKRRHSLVMTDPKGELYHDMAGYLQDNGYIVRRLDFKNLEKSDGWDCLRSLRGKGMRTKVQIFSNAAISNISPNDHSIFSTGSDSLLQALILRVLLGHDFTDEEKNIRSVYELLQNPAGYEYLEQMFDKNLLTEEELPCLAPYLAYKQGSENLSSNIATHLANGLQLFQDGDLCRVMSTDDIDLTLPGKQPCAYFCVFPDDHDTYRFVISLFFTMFFIELIGFADSQKNLRLPVPVDFLLDEFPSIGVIPDWHKKMSTIRSRGISAVMITQDFTQLKQNYEDTWSTILSNCGAIITLGINEMDTAEWISKRIGETSIEVESTSETNVAGARRKELVTKDSIGVGKRNLFTASEIFEIGQDNNLVVIAGRNPIFSLKTPYTIFPESKKLRDIEMEDIVDITDEEGRKKLRQFEDAYVKQYWSTHNMHQIGNAQDLSDVLYTEPPKSPLSMSIDVIKDDFKRAKSWYVNTFKKKQEASAPDTEVKPKDNEPHLSNETAEKGAFLTFCEEYQATGYAMDQLASGITSNGDIFIMPDDDGDEDVDTYQEPTTQAAQLNSSDGFQNAPSGFIVGGVSVGNAVSVGGCARDVGIGTRKIAPASSEATKTASSPSGSGLTGNALNGRKSATGQSEPSAKKSDLSPRKEVEEPKKNEGPSATPVSSSTGNAGNRNTKRRNDAYKIVDERQTLYNQNFSGPPLGKSK